MVPRLAADALVVIHLAFVAFAVFGSLACLRWPRLAVLHLPVLAWASYVEFAGAACPLTPLENHWRQLAGIQGYAGGFVDHYLLPVLYPPGLGSDGQFWLGILLVAGNAAIYAACWWRARLRRDVPAQE